ncbi:PQQ-binding-like beta-propeller repeat protein [Actinoallomurus sp. NPDC050550]|uniref:outer membrane protein assembly factor BamB family protein n=1 Tax=Actinoallomurus sp. NPDC050550 TaxID=3154937 RepID=UPI0033F917E8
MTYDGERPPAGTSSRPQRRVVVPVVIDGPGAPRGRFWRSRLVAAGVAGVVLAAWGLVQLFGNPFGGDGMRGPYGQFPSAVAAQPPLHSARPVARVGGAAIVFGGLAIINSSTLDTHRGVRAVDIATGKLYWHYQRDASLMAIDRATGGLFLLGTRLTLIDIRSGRVRWLVKAPEADLSYGLPDRLVADAGALTIIGEDGVAGIDRADGRVRWTKVWPASCHFDGGDHSLHVAVAAGTIAVTCNDLNAPNKSVLGFDPGTGSLRWNLQTSDLFPDLKPVNDNGYYDDNYLDGIWTVDGRLAVGVGGAITLLDPVTGTVTGRRHWADGRSPIAFSDAIQISLCSQSVHAQDLCGDAPATGKALWHTHLQRPPGHPTCDQPWGDRGTVVDGRRVYVAMACMGTGKEREVQQLTVLDAGTGRELAHIPLSDYGFMGGGIEGPTDGVISLLNNNGSTTLLADRPDLHTITIPR